ncbi:hypothetical protein [Ketobacter alkanivorans]|uniref:SMODS and SLOG-associating 2TM effector domain-containing protein n=1 Tax=Ketobacter alkanivorans TaxID=1917421 RepID=A0A2K9LQU5_9GAMM|nr:hypothetical protein [Ketobacter alkanivorans]AUM14698.1 hypothetical protein Kalk_20690 [Ketobacter alkanivorans]
MNPEIKQIRPVDVARRLRTQSNEELKSWVRMIITISSTFLSVLIAFKENYVPDNPEFSFLLILGFIFFVVVIFSGVVILHTEVQTKFDSANEIDNVLDLYGEEAAVQHLKGSGSKAIARPIYLYAHFAFHISFALGFVFVVAFLSFNW